MSLFFRICAVIFLSLIRTAYGGEAVGLDSLIEQCRFTVDGNSYDLCPLLSGRKDSGWVVRYERQTPPSILTGRYWIKVDGKLPKNESLSANRQVSLKGQPGAINLSVRGSETYSYGAVSGWDDDLLDQ